MVLENLREAVNFGLLWVLFEYDKSKFQAKSSTPVRANVAIEEVNNT